MTLVGRLYTLRRECWWGRFFSTTEPRRRRRATEIIQMSTQREISDLSYRIIGCAIAVHKQIGPGLLESVYEACMIEELRSAGMSVQSQVFIPVYYKGKDLGCKLKLDLLINEKIIVELKAVEFMIPLYKAQLLSYLKLTGKPKGLLINFNCLNIKDDVISLVSKEYANLP